MHLVSTHPNAPCIIIIDLVLIIIIVFTVRSVLLMQMPIDLGGADSFMVVWMGGWSTHIDMVVLSMDFNLIILNS